MCVFTHLAGHRCNDSTTERNETEKVAIVPLGPNLYAVPVHLIAKASDVYGVPAHLITFTRCPRLYGHAVLFNSTAPLIFVRDAG